MTTDTSNTNDSQTQMFRKNSRGGRILAGSIVVTVGAFFLMKTAGVLLPYWLFSWQMFLIVLGIFLGAKHNFKRGGWWIVSLVGVVFLADDLITGVSLSQYFWPVIVIAAGLAMIFKPKKDWSNNHWRNKWEEKFNAQYSERGNTEDYIDSTSIFGGIKKNIISKNFKGGDIVCVFGGSEINLMQADINGRVVLEVTQIFGGTKLLVPAHWEVVPEMVAILGGIEDKRPPYNNQTPDGTKVLVINGTSIFGGIDIRSY